jgi:hypothetical protein
VALSLVDEGSAAVDLLLDSACIDLLRFTLLLSVPWPESAAAGKPDWLPLPLLGLWPMTRATRTRPKLGSLDGGVSRDRASTETSAVKGLIVEIYGPDALSDVAPCSGYFRYLTLMESTPGN